MARNNEDNSLMGQYNGIKAKHPDAILLFRVGDFYETFGKDAIKASEILGITLTSRNNGYAATVELAGFPHHALETYLPKLVRAGQRVAVCDQLEDPKMAKGIVKRGITELVTPGVAIGDNVLENKENNFLGCVNIERNAVGVAFLDISTGEFMMGEGSVEYVDRLLATFKPKEVLYEKGKRQAFIECFGTKWLTYPFDDWAFEPSQARERLLKQFETQSLKGFGVDRLEIGTTAAGAIMHYLDVTQHDHLKHISTLSRIEGDNYVWLDKFTVRNLELFPSGIDGTTSLTDILDRTLTPMGARMLKRWVSLPLKDKATIDLRLGSVLSLATDDNQNGMFKEQLSDMLKSIGDLERLVGKASTYRITPREMIQLKRTLFAITPLKQLLSQSSSEHLRALAASLEECVEAREKIDREIAPEPPTNVAKGGAIADGVNAELDELRHISTSSKDYLTEMQERLTEETGITSLKVAFNNVFGYYIEVRNTHKDKVPDTWIRKQTLANAERYITEELKQYEEKILHADERILQLESQIYNNLILFLSSYLMPIQRDAAVLSEIDVLLSFRTIADDNSYCCPEIRNDDVLDIVDGRHPVIERLLPIGEQYISNSVHLDHDNQQIIIITGPNMAGKSALLRQTALIVLMAQIGSFVPAKAASIGIVDKIFTRVGASDNISQGESTFMVEMTEASNILNNVTPKSLVLFDELGRGTSTYDGISLAWSIVEYLHNNKKAQAKTLFATHYHELNEMEEKYERIHNFNVSVKEMDGKVIFMRKLLPGGSEHSFGIHVAKLAGMPKSVVSRATEILHQLESSHRSEDGMTAVSQSSASKNTKSNDGAMQLSFFQLDDPVLSQIRDEIAGLDINNLTPIEALNKLNDIKKLIGLK
ncbi:MAG: DNA mismatch repair protein MutS [Bacteroidales bacterium]|nr:DNA mismatch repair protein MutS [Bacteroidales bacterium]